MSFEAKIEEKFTKCARGKRENQIHILDKSFL